MHNTPRYGHGNDISILAAKEYAPSLDYYLGLSFISSFFLGFIFLWAVTTILFRVLKSNADWKYRALAGRTFKVSQKEIEKNLESIAKRIIKIRLCFLCLGFLLIGSAIKLMLDASRLHKAAEVVHSNAIVSIQ